MKDMSNRDKMILIIITIIIILVAGFFALIKPKYEQYSADIDAYNATKAEYDGMKMKLDAIPGLKSSITDAYNDANATAKIFVNEAFDDANKNYDTNKINRAVDMHIQSAIDESNLEVRSLALGGVSSKTVEYFYYTPNVVTYSLLEAADVNGNYVADVADILNTSLILSQRKLAEVQTNTVTLAARGTKENIMTFFDKINEDKNAVLVTQAGISDYLFLGGLSEDEPIPVTTEPPVQEPQFDEEGNPIEPEPTEAPVVQAPNPSVVTIEGEGWSDVNLIITFYNAKPIDTPELGD